MDFSKLKIAIVHDWFTSYAGSEKVIESLTNIFPDADIFSLVDFLNDNERKIILKGKKAKTSFIQNLPAAKSKYRNYLLFFPFAIEQFDLSNYDLIISSSHAVAKGVLTHANQLHICYCHTPIRYAWDLYHQYLREANLEKGLAGIVAKKILHYIRIWDFTTANRPNFFVANSKYISKRIKKVYDKNSDVIYPPVDVENFSLQENKEEFYLTASRFVPYKKMDLIVEAFSKMPEKKLIVIGDGPDENKIKSKAAANIEFAGYLPSDKLKVYMQKAKAFVFAAEEDFGITPVEALACGTPVIAFKKGGAFETVQNEINGIHFDEQTPQSIIDAVKKFESMQIKFDAKQIRESALKFSRENFENNFKNFVEEKLKIFYE